MIHIKNINGILPKKMKCIKHDGMVNKCPCEEEDICDSIMLRINKVIDGIGNRELYLDEQVIIMLISAVPEAKYLDARAIARMIVNNISKIIKARI